MNKYNFRYLYKPVRPTKVTISNYGIFGPKSIIEKPAEWFVI